MIEKTDATGKESDIHIVGLLSRQQGDVAQSLIVIGTVEKHLGVCDLWVALEREEPVEVKSLDQYLRVETPRILRTGEFDQMGLNSEDHAALTQAIVVAPNHIAWLARFDFSDHGSLVNIWQQRTFAAANAAPIKVLVWQSERNPQSPAVFKPTTKIARSAVEWSEIVTQKCFELGILFVHGIGPHKPRETLLHFGEPFIDFWLDVFRALNRQQGAVIGRVAATAYLDEANQRGLRAREDEDGAKKMFARFAEHAPEVPQSATNLGDLYCAWLRAEDTLMGDGPKDEPSATLLRLMRGYRDGGERDSHILMAEAWWVNEAIRPGIQELKNWLRDVIPATLSMHIAALARQRPDRSSTAGLDATSLPLLDGVGTWRATLEWPVWFAKMLLLAPAYTLTAMGRQAAFALIGGLALMPVPWIQRLAKGTLGVLMGTLGQSHALETSPVRRNAIVRRVVAQLEWLSDRCQRVVVVSHSQGAEVMRLVFQLRRRKEIARWVTFGAGIRPLVMLERDRLSDPEFRRNAREIWLGSVFGAAAAVTALLWVIPALLPVNLSVFCGYFAVVTALTCFVQALHCTFIMSRKAGSEWKPMGIFRARRSIMAVWHDYFASRDPVPGGSLLSEFKSDLSDTKNWNPEKRPREFEIHNARCGLLDHTTYLDNVEQFVAPVAVDLLVQAGMVGAPDKVQEALDASSLRRSVYTWTHYAVRNAAIVACVVLVLGYVLSWSGELAPWTDQVRVTWRVAASVSAGVCALWNSGLVGKALQLFWPLILVGVAVIMSNLIMGWRQRASRKQLQQGLAAAYLAGANLP